MSSFIPRQRIEQRATEHWRRYGLNPGFDIERLIDRLDLGVLWEPIPPSRGLTVAAELMPEDRRVRLNDTLRGLLDGNPGFYRFTLAHEIGHWDLHCDSSQASRDGLFPGDAVICRRLVFGRDDPPEDHLSQSEGRREHQANLYATYLLAPTEVLKTILRETGCDGWASIYALSERLGLSAQATLVRLDEEGLGYRDAAGVPRSGRRPQPGQVTLGL